jgi:signal transduction histidine kinase
MFRVPNRSRNGSPDQLNQTASGRLERRAASVYHRRWAPAHIRENRRAIRSLATKAAESERDLTTLLEIARNLAAMLELEPLLDLILDQVRVAVDYDSAGVLIVQDGVLVQLAQRGPVPDRTAVGRRWPLDDTPFLRRTLDGETSLVIDDVWADDPTARDYRQAVSEAWLRKRPDIRSWTGLPLHFRGRTLGLMVVCFGEPAHFTSHHVRLLTAVAAQASVAIENARLVAATRETAAQAERQRLARDLHDAVTQTLFSASLIGDVLPALWARNPDRGAEALADLRLLTRGALAEMRTLLFELRPGALVETPLGDLLRHLADAVTGQSRLPVTVTAEGVPLLPADVQVACYRIAQEALNNAVKHAHATRVALQVTATPAGGARLRVRDDGSGFEPDHRPAGHFGLATMHERAEAIGATLSVLSAPGLGTDITLVWPGGRAVSAGAKE